MAGVTQPIDSLSAWSHLNDLDFFDVKVADVVGSGLGLIAERALSRSEETFDVPALLKIPRALLLSQEAVELYAKMDGNFRQLLDVAGRKSARGDILLYLLTHLVFSTMDPSKVRVGVPTPWTEYVKYLPGRVPVPTLWKDLELELLEGTSLEPAVAAKLSTLTREFEDLRDAVAALPFWDDLFGEEGTASLQEWMLVDAWYRSRCLEIPSCGPTMVPALDMVNHSSNPNAYYEENDRGDILLLLRPGCTVAPGEEITITYGEYKPAVEMLFSYGFVDPDRTVDKLSLPLEPMSDDPLAKAKLHAFKGTPTVEIGRVREERGDEQGGGEEIDVEEVAAERRQAGDGLGGSSSQPGSLLVWSSPFAFFSCLNEEDGLIFRLLQTTDGNQQLRVFWQDQDVTDQTDQFSALIAQHPSLEKIFCLRAVTVVQDRVRAQLDQLSSGAISEIDLEALEAQAGAGAQRGILVRQGCIRAARLLREREAVVLEQALLVLEMEKTQLLADENVVAYLGSMETAENEQASSAPANEEEDFS